MASGARKPLNASNPAWTCSEGQEVEGVSRRLPMRFSMRVLYRLPQSPTTRSMAPRLSRPHSGLGTPAH